MFTGDREGEEDDIPEIYPTNNQIYNFTTLVGTMYYLYQMVAQIVLRIPEERYFLTKTKNVTALDLAKCLD